MPCTPWQDWPKLHILVNNLVSRKLPEETTAYPSQDSEIAVMLVMAKPSVISRLNSTAEKTRSPKISKA